MKLGVTLPQFSSDPDVFLDGARRAEAAGLDSVWVFDHLWPLSGGKERPVLEGWSALAHVAAATSRVTIGTLVTRSSLRHPALLAKMAATAAAVAPGRLVVGIGSGDELSRPENEAFGLPHYEGKQRVGQLGSTVEAVTTALRLGEVSLHDDFVSLERLVLSPQARPAPEIWVGSWAPEALELAGRRAQGWNGWMGSPERFGRAAARLKAAAPEEGPQVTLSWGGQIVLGATRAEADAKLGERDPSHLVVDDVSGFARRLDALAARGCDHAICAFPDAKRAGSYELLAEQVRPLLG